MPRTERVLGGVIVTGIAACLGLMLWPMGPKNANASGPGAIPVETPAHPVDTLVTASAAPSETLDPLTEAVVRSTGPGSTSTPIRFTLGTSPKPGPALATFSGETEISVPIAVDLGEVLSKRMVFLGSESKLVADFDGDAQLTDGDTEEFQRLWETADPKADLNGDGEIDATDFAAFVDAYNGQDRSGGGSNSIKLHFTTQSTPTQETVIGEGGGGLVNFSGVELKLELSPAK